MILPSPEIFVRVFDRLVKLRLQSFAVPSYVIVLGLFVVNWDHPAPLPFRTWMSAGASLLIDVCLIVLFVAIIVFARVTIPNEKKAWKRVRAAKRKP